MKLVKQFETMSISNFILITKGGVIYKDPSVQRRLCWDKNNKEGYLSIFIRKIECMKFIQINTHGERAPPISCTRRIHL